MMEEGQKAALRLGCESRISYAKAFSPRYLFFHASFCSRLLPQRLEASRKLQFETEEDCGWIHTLNPTKYVKEPVCYSLIAGIDINMLNRKVRQLPHMDPSSRGI